MKDIRYLIAWFCQNQSHFSDLKIRILLFFAQGLFPTIYQKTLFENPIWVSENDITFGLENQQLFDRNILQQLDVQLLERDEKFFLRTLIDLYGHFSDQLLNQFLKQNPVFKQTNIGQIIDIKMLIHFFELSPVSFQLKQRDWKTMQRIDFADANEFGNQVEGNWIENE